MAGEVKLTKPQLAALTNIVRRDGYYTPWALGTSTCEALRTRGLVKGDRPFRGRFKYDPYLWATDLGRAALAKSEGAERG